MTLCTGLRACARAMAAVPVALGLLLAVPLHAGTLKGYVDAVQGATLVVVEGHSVELRPSTRVERRDDPGFSVSDLRPGWEVEVETEADAERAGRLAAKRLKVLTRPRVPIAVEGFVEKVEEGWLQVDGWPIHWPEGLAQGAVELGMDLSGRGVLLDDGTVRLRTWKLEAKRDDPGEREFLVRVAAELAGLRQKLRAVSDPTLQDYVRRVGMRVAPEQVRRTEGALAFYVVDAAEPNAFALPDGTIVVHSGLLDLLSNEAQLACVLGHEIAHVTHGHAYRSFKAGRRFRTLVAVVASVTAGLSSLLLGDDAPARVLNSFGSGLALSAAVNGYGRNLENDADRIGLHYAFDAGYDPYQSVAVWRALSRRTRARSRVSNWFFGNHATQQARIANLTKELNARYRSRVQPGSLAQNQLEYRQAVGQHAAGLPHAVAGVDTGGVAAHQPQGAATAACLAIVASYEQGAGVDGVDARGNTVLMSAVQACSLAEVRRLVEHGADPNPEPNAQDFTPLGMALVSGKWDVAEFLVEHGARLETSQIDALFLERPTDPRLLAILERAEQKEASQ
jgi:Zn-dependent protease with chaperone function